MSVLTNRVSVAFKLAEENQTLTRLVNGSMLALWIAAASTGTLDRSVHIAFGLGVFVLISVHMILRHTANEALQGRKKVHTFWLSTLFKLMVVSGIAVAAISDSAGLVFVHRLSAELFGLLMIAHLWTKRQWIAQQLAHLRHR